MNPGTAGHPCILLPPPRKRHLPGNQTIGCRGLFPEDEMMQLEFTAPIPPALSKAEIAARFPELPKGWTAQQDLDLVEGLFKLNGLMRIALSMGKPFDDVQARFLQLRKAAVKGIGPFSLTAQSRLLEVVRERAK